MSFMYLLDGGVDYVDVELDHRLVERRRDPGHADVERTGPGRYGWRRAATTIEHVITLRNKRPMKSTQIQLAQRGVALAVVLILLVVMMLLGLAAMRGTLMEERMTSNQYDRSLAFQAAEAALREGEIDGAGKPDPTGTTCANGICPTPVATDTPRWLDTDANWLAMSKQVDEFDRRHADRQAALHRRVDGDRRSRFRCTTSGDLSPDAACSGHGAALPHHRAQPGRRPRRRDPAVQLRCAINAGTDMNVDIKRSATRLTAWQRVSQ